MVSAPKASQERDILADNPGFELYWLVDMSDWPDFVVLNAPPPRPAPVHPLEGLLADLRHRLVGLYGSGHLALVLGVLMVCVGLWLLAQSRPLPRASKKTV